MRLKINLPLILFNIITNFITLSLLFVSTIALSSCENNIPKKPTDDTDKYVATDLSVLQLPAGVKNDAVLWDKSGGTVTFVQSTSFSIFSNPDEDKEGFYWSVPPVVKTVIIEKNVKLTGGFRANGDLLIEGSDRTSSEIFGTNTKNWSLGPDGKTDENTSCSSGAKGDDRVHDCEKWRYGAISSTADLNTTVTVKNLTITNARSYAITTFGPKVLVDNVHIQNTRPKPDYHSNSDGISAGTGSMVRNSRIDTWDDAIKLYRDMTVENVTIVHNENGAPFQLGWHSKSKASGHSLKNILIVVNNANYTNLAMFSASLTTGELTANVAIDGLKAVYAADQKIKRVDPLPLFLLKSPDGVLNLTADNVELSAPIGFGGKGNVHLTICGSNEIRRAYKCGNVSEITGCGW